MTEDLRRITIDSLIAVTGMGKRTTMRLIREGRLPGYFEGIHYVCPPGEFDRWYRGEWTPTPRENGEPDSEAVKPIPPVSFLTQRRKSA